MEGQIKTSEFIQDDGGLQRIEKQLLELEQVYIRLMDRTKKDATAVKSRLDKLNETQATQQATIRRTAQDADELSRRYKRYNDSLTENAKKIAQVKNLQTQQNQLNKLNAQLNQAQVGSYDRLNAQYRINTIRLKAMTEEQRKNTTAGRRLERQTEELRREMNKLRVGGKGLIGTLQGIGNALKAAFLAGGIVGGIMILVRQISDAIRTTAEFKEQIAILGAVSKASKTELAELEANARKLGETTQFTASQVAELQINLARSGFNPQEIIAATEATLDLALATKSELGPASVVVADNIRAYGLEAKDAARFTDVLTAALNSSNLTLESYAEASKEIAPISKVLNISLEETTAAIGILADNGLKGTAATTTLASGLLKLSDDSKKYAKAAERYNVQVFKQNGQFVGLSQLITNLNESFKDFTEQQRLAALAQIFGIQSARNFAILLNAQKEVVTETGKEVLKGGEALKGYAEQLERSGQAASRAADFIGDTLAGDLKAMASAAEGAKINFVAFFEDGIRKVVQGVTSLIGGVNDYLRIPLSEQLADQQRELNGLIGALINTEENVTDLNVKEEVRSRLISEIQAKYPDFIRNIDLETASTEQLRAALKDVNDQFTQRIILQRQEEELTALFEKRATLIEDLVKFQQEQASGEIRLRQNVLGGGIGDTTVEDDIARTQRVIERIDAKIAEVNDRRASQIDEINRLLGISGKETEDAAADAADGVTGLGKATGKTKEKVEAAAGSVAYFREQVQKLKTQLETSGPEKSEGLLVKLIGAEDALKDAEEKLELLRKRLERQKETPFGIIPSLKQVEGQLDRVVTLTDESRADSLLAAFDDYQKLEESRFKLVARTEKEITAFRLRQERDRLMEILRLNKDLGEVQRETIRNQIIAINNSLKNAGVESSEQQRDIFSFLGINIDEDKKRGLKSTFDFLKGQIIQFYEFRREQADKNREIADREVEAAQRNLQIEIENAKNGFDARVELREQELQQARRNQEIAIREQEKAQKKEQQIQTIQQTGNLITAASKIWKDFGFPLAIPFITLMFGSFLATKIKAGQLAKREFREGVSEHLDYGGAHGSGKDIYLGKDKKGRPRYAERGEIMGIYSRKAVGKYGSKLIDEVINSVNNLSFESVFQARNTVPEGANIFLNAPGTDMRKTESTLDAIRRQNERQVIQGRNGSLIVIHGQNTRVYR